MYLSKLVLNPMNWKARRDFSSPYETHRTISNLFPDSDVRKYLFRIEQLDRKSSEMAILVQSEEKPDMKSLEKGYLLENTPKPKALDKDKLKEVFAKKGTYNFRITANATTKREGKKFPIYDEEGQKRWMVKKAETHGFKLLSLRFASFTFGDKRKTEKLKGKKIAKENKKNLYFLAVKYEGVLKITEPEKFYEVFAKGLGPSKAFGFGLLSIAPV